MPNNLHPVQTMCDEGSAFCKRHPGLSETQATWGALTWGLLRAIYECPDCPGHYRRPLEGMREDIIICPHCGRVWIHKNADPNYVYTTLIQYRDRARDPEAFDAFVAQFKPPTVQEKLL